MAEGFAYYLIWNGEGGAGGGVNMMGDLVTLLINK